MGRGKMEGRGRGQSTFLNEILAYCVGLPRPQGPAFCHLQYGKWGRPGT